MTTITIGGGLGGLGGLDDAAAGPRPSPMGSSAPLAGSRRAARAGAESAMFGRRGDGRMSAGVGGAAALSETVVGSGKGVRERSTEGSRSSSRQRASSRNSRSSSTRDAAGAGASAPVDALDAHLLSGSTSGAAPRASRGGIARGGRGPVIALPTGRNGRTSGLSGAGSRFVGAMRFQGSS